MEENDIKEERDATTQQLISLKESISIQIELLRKHYHFPKVVHFYG